MVKAKDVVKKATNAVAKSVGYGDHQGQGITELADVSAKLGSITIIHALSKIVTEGNVEGAVPGNLYNTLTGEVFDGKVGIGFTPLAIVQSYQEYGPKGIGWLANHPADDPVIQEAVKSSEWNDIKLPNGNALKETYSILAMIFTDENDLGPARISFQGSNLKVFRDLSARLLNYRAIIDGETQTPPLFAHRCRLTVQKKQGKDNVSYFGFGKILPFGGSMQDSLIPADSDNFKNLVACKQQIQEKLDAAKANRALSAPSGTVEEVPF